MTEFNRINAPRIDKILHMIATIEKSARSNKADPAEVADLLRPILNALETTFAMGSQSPSATPAPVQHQSRLSKSRRDITLWQEAQTAPLAELMMAWGVINARLSDLVTDQEYGDG